MRARKYNKKIDVYEISNQPEGFGGNYVTPVLVSSCWAHITTLERSNRKTEDGESDAFETLVITIRKKSSLDLEFKKHYIMYRNVKYTILQAPINKGFKDTEIEFKAISN